jgi:UDP-glucose 4-epimerase
MILRPDGPVWVVGAGGMIGAELVAHLGGEAHVAPAFPWSDTPELARAFDAAAKDYVALLDGRAPSVVWVAGKAVIGSDSAVHRAEVEAVGAMLLALERHAGHLPGILVLVSSAGGIYAGSTGPPYDESTRPAPLSDYGTSKLEEEELVRAFASRTEWGVTIARLANVYGPGQSTAKEQGIVTRLCRAAVLGEPVRLFVPLATTRHYVHVSDVARMLIAQLDAARSSDERVRLRVLSAGHAVSLSELLAAVQLASSLQLPVHHELDPAAEWHGLDLRLASRFDDARLADPLPLLDGIEQLFDAFSPGMTPGGHEA